LSAKRVGLIGNAVSDHDELFEIREGFFCRNVSIHPPSLRIDKISPETMKILAKSGLRSVTLAPETADEKIGKKIHKWIPSETLVEKSAHLAEYGIKEIKLYWILGLPDSDDSETQQIANAIKEIVSKTSLKITASINPFVPKPHSEFAAMPMFSDAELKQKFGYIRSILKGTKDIKLELNYSVGNRLDAILSNFGEEISPALAAIASGGGIKTSLKKSNIDLDASIVAQQALATERIK